MNALNYIVAGAAIATFAYFGTRERPAPRPPAVAIEQPIAKPAAVVAPASAPSAPVRPAPVVTALDTRSKLVDKYAATGHPYDAFTAYSMVAHCVYARRQESSGTPEARSAEVCADITPTQIVTRLQWLEKAAAAGVHGAFEAFVAEGESGDRTIGAPESDDYAARADRYQQAGIRTGDPISLASYSTRLENAEKPDLVGAAAYWYAYLHVAGPKDGPKGKPILDGILSKLSPDQQRAALAEGAAIIQRATR